jgi:hypothetical protein
MVNTDNSAALAIDITQPMNQSIVDDIATIPIIINQMIDTILIHFF